MTTTLAEPLDPALLGPTTQVHARSIDRFARAHDASHYLLIPDAVLSPAAVSYKHNRAHETLRNI